MTFLDKLSLLPHSQLDWRKIITWLSTRRKKMSFLRKILFSQIKVDRSVYRNNYLNKLDPQFLIIKEENLFVFCVICILDLWIKLCVHNGPAYWRTKFTCSEDLWFHASAANIDDKMHFIFSVLAKQRVYDASSFTLWPLLIHECSIEDKQKMKRMVFLWLSKM